jgi:hypothetical protein
MRRTRTTLTVAVLALLAACGGQDDTATVEPSAPVTSDETAPPDETAPSDETAAATELSITTSAGAEAAASSQQTYLLTCDPAGGDHPDPDVACAVLAELGAEAFAAPPKDLACTEQYGGPETASVTGTVDGEPVLATFDRTDGCAISRWDALGPVLAVEAVKHGGAAVPDSRHAS